MAPLPRSAIMSALARTRFQQAAVRQFRVRQYATARAARLEQAPGHWGAHWKRAGGTAMMYFPVVAVVMFWPYIVEPIVNIYEGV